MDKACSFVRRIKIKVKKRKKGKKRITPPPHKVPSEDIAAGNPLDQVAW